MRTTDVVKRARARLAQEADPALGRRLRLQCGLSQRDVGDVVGVNRVEICRWERGSRTPKGARLVRYRRLLVRLAQELSRG